MPVDLEQNHALIQTNKSMLHYVCITQGRLNGGNEIIITT